MNSVSLVPDTIDRLVRLFSDALEPESTDDHPIQVLDGQPVTTTEDDVVAVGFTGDSNEPAVEVTRTREQLTADPDRESFEVVCLMSSWRGDDSMKQVRDRVYHFLDLINDALMEDPTLDGLVARINLRTEALAQEQTSEGPVATIRFVVGVDAYTKRRL